MKRLVSLFIAAVLIMSGNVCYAVDKSINAADAITDNNADTITGTKSGAEADNVVPLAAGDVEINETNFPDANFRNWLLSQTYGSDSKLTETEAADITRLDVSELSIADLTGIEYFKALTYLACCNNNLTKLDVSQNTALTELYCFQNNLTTLDVSQNTALTTLFCNQNNLTMLNVSGNTALDWLTCDQNDLTTLDISQNTALTYLHCSDNNLTTLDVNQNTALTVLRCSDNNLTTLDVSQNTALTDLNCSMNNLTTLDVSQNIALTWLECWRDNLTTLDVSQNTALTVLLCDQNDLTALDVSQNTVLTSLRCGLNNLITLDVSQNTALTELYCYNNNLTTLDVSQNTALTGFDCGGNDLTMLDLSQNTNLPKIKCDISLNPIQNLKLPTGEELIIKILPSKGGHIILENLDYDSRQVYYRATPYDGYTFDGWTGDAEGTGENIFFDLSGNMTVTANFSINAQEPEIEEHPQDKTAKVGDSVSLKVSATVNDGGELSYQWYSNTQKDNTGGTPIPGATADSYAPPADTAGTRYYYVVITNTNNGKTADATSNPAEVRIEEVEENTQEPEIIEHPQDKTAKVGDSVSLKVSATVDDGGELSYQWYSNTQKDNTGGTPIPGATADSYAPPADTAGITYYYVVITNTNNGKTADATSNPAEVRIEEVKENTQEPEIIEHPQDKTAKVGDSVSLKVSATVNDGGELSYQWYSNTQKDNTGGTPIPGATDDSYEPPADTAGTKYYYVVITNTNNGKTADATSNPAAVTVEAVKTYAVTFKDWDGTILKSEIVNYGEAATAPVNPNRKGYIFEGWDVAFDNVTSDLTVMAQYTKIPEEDADILEEAKGLDPSNADDLEKLKELEDIYKDRENVTVEIVADANTHGNFKQNLDMISVVGAAFNAEQGETITLHFSKPENNVVIDGNRYKTNNAVQFDIRLMNGTTPLQDLDVPITITVPVPSGVEESNFCILHYHNNGDYEVIAPKLNGNGTCTFTVTNFSVFAFVNGVEANGNGNDVTQKPASSDMGADKASINPKSISNAPKTGDETNTIIWMILAIISMTAIVIILLRRKYNYGMR